MRDTFLPFSPPDIGDAESAEVAEAVRSGWVTTGPRTRRFSEAFASFVGADAALALSSGTAALHAAHLAYGLGPGECVVVPAMTFASAVHVVEHCGATPILVDVDPLTLNMDVSKVDEAIASSRGTVRSISPAHLYGHPCDLASLVEIADRRGLVIVDDAAHALPAAVNGQSIGGSRHPSLLTAFSFYATKNLTTGEGGMLTGPPELIEVARSWILHGMTKDAWGRHENAAAWRYDVDRPGFKYNLSDIASAIGLVQLQRLPEMHERRRSIVSRYEQGLSAVDAVQLPVEHPGYSSAWHIYATRLNLDRLRITRDRFIDELANRNIGSSVHFIPVHILSYYRKRYGYAPDDFPVAMAEFERLVSLPLNTTLTDEDVDDVIAAVCEIATTFSA